MTDNAGHKNDVRNLNGKRWTSPRTKNSFLL